MLEMSFKIMANASSESIAGLDFLLAWTFLFWYCSFFFTLQLLITVDGPQNLSCEGILLGYILSQFYQASDYMFIQSISLGSSILGMLALPTNLCVEIRCRSQ